MLARTADGALVLDQDGKVVFWHGAAERLLGVRANEVLRRPSHEVMRGKTLGVQTRLQAFVLAVRPGLRTS